MRWRLRWWSQRARRACRCSRSTVRRPTTSRRPLAAPPPRAIELPLTPVPDGAASSPPADQLQANLPLSLPGAATRPSKRPPKAGRPLEARPSRHRASVYIAANSPQSVGPAVRARGRNHASYSRCRSAARRADHAQLPPEHMHVFAQDLGGALQPRKPILRPAKENGRRGRGASGPGLDMPLPHL